MTVETLPHAREQLAWEFLDMKADSGAIAVSWDKSLAWVALYHRPLIVLTRFLLVLLAALTSQGQTTQEILPRRARGDLGRQRALR